MRFVVLAACAAITCAQQTLPTGWRIEPAGKQIPVGTLPASSALSPDGRYMVVVSDGAAHVLRTSDAMLLSTTPAAGAWKGVAFSMDGRFVYVGAAINNRIYEYSIDDVGNLTLSKEIAVDGFTSDIAIPPGGRLLYTTDFLGDRVILVNPQTGMVIGRARTGRRPYEILFHPDGRSYYVTAMGDGAVIQYDADRGSELSRHRVGPQPAGMAWSDRKPDDTTEVEYRLFVTAANTNNVYTIHIDRNKAMTDGDVLNIGFAAGIPAGMTPTAVALSRDQTRLYVACSGVNAIAVADITEARGRLAAFIPTGAYPTDVRVLNDDGVAVLNGISGTATVIDAPDEAALTAHTERALGLVAYSGETYEEAGAVLSSAMQHVLYIRNEAPAGPNSQKLEREFAAVRNFTANSSPAIEGLYWTLAGMPPHFTRLLATKQPSSRFESDPANLPAAGFLWNNARTAGLTVEYFDVFSAERPEIPAQIPRLAVMRHTGTDAELGQIVEAVSKSAVWPRTAIFIEQPNRPLLIVSPYTRGVTVPANGFYNQSSLLRTMELILKLRPFTLFDGAAPPITAAFQAAPKTESYVPSP